MIHKKCGCDATYTYDSEKTKGSNIFMERYWCPECCIGFDVVVGKGLIQLDNNQQSIKELTEVGVI
jgi:hypothetical protein